MRPDPWSSDLLRALLLFATSVVVAVLVILFTDPREARPNKTTEGDQVGRTNGSG